ncbi:MAG: ATP-binding protein [Planctomycetia bacterium]|nr:ATP-binding protein [Planctomycetia bacterium]
MASCSNDAAAWRREMKFPSVSGCGEQFVDSIVEELTRRSWPEHVLFGVRLAFDEAIANAVEHGNRHDSQKSVLIGAEITDKRLLMTIKDEGAGFCRNDVPNPLAEENLDKPTGRGLFLIKNFMTRVWHNDAGNVIFMEKVLTQEDLDATT